MVKNPFMWTALSLGALRLVRLHGELNRDLRDHTSSLVDEAVAIINESGKSSGDPQAAMTRKSYATGMKKGINVISAGSDYVHIMDRARRGIQNMLRQIQAK